MDVYEKQLEEEIPDFGEHAPGQHGGKDTMNSKHQSRVSYRSLCGT